MLVEFIVGLSGLIASGLFIYSLKSMSSPVTAVKGIVVAGYGMLFVIIASFLTLFNTSADVIAHLPVNIGLAIIALVLGGVWAAWKGKQVQMTAMPQMVALYNGMGGGSAAALAAVALLNGKESSTLHLLITVLGALIGSVSLTGSVVAWAKLDDRLKTYRYSSQKLVNAALFAITVILGLATVFFYGTESGAIYRDVFFLGALIFGICMTMPIGGADMPVVISLYNAFTGLAVGLEGYVINSPALMIAGMVVGSAGTLLTILMAKAMNRSLTNVLFSDFGDSSAQGSVTEQGEMKSVEPGDAATTMRYATSVIIVPGYGLAVAQAQQKLYEMVKLLQNANVSVKFAIHPVAGRMPGHMNVLLAEAGVPYDMIFDMDEINESFPNTDVALVIGANDVVNPSARSDKSSPIYGMPILDVDKSREVFIIKRGRGKGYSGVENPLFFNENSTMVFGDAQAVLSKMVESLKALDIV